MSFISVLKRIDAAIATGVSHYTRVTDRAEATALHSQRSGELADRGDDLRRPGGEHGWFEGVADESHGCCDAAIVAGVQNSDQLGVVADARLCELLQHGDALLDIPRRDVMAGWEHQRLGRAIGAAPQPVALLHLGGTLPRTCPRPVDSAVLRPVDLFVSVAVEAVVLAPDLDVDAGVGPLLGPDHAPLVTSRPAILCLLRHPEYLFVQSRGSSPRD